MFSQTNMNKHKKWILILLCLTIVCVYNRTYTESFYMPKQIKASFRPIQRQVRIHSLDIYSKSVTRISNFFRRFGIV
jgi:hypothetical protein